MTTTHGLPPYLVSTDWLAAELGAPDLRILDCTVHLKPDPPRPYRIESGRADYDAGHIPGAGFLDLGGELSAPDNPLPFTLPSAERFMQALSRHGVGPGTRVVLYSGSMVPWATRAFWMLRAFGFDTAAVLDGGLAKWRAEGRPLTSEPANPPPATFVARPRGGLFVGKEDVRRALGRADTVIVNALSPEAHRGDAPVNYGRPGHIAGSCNVFFQTLLAPDGTFLRDDALRAPLAAKGLLDAPHVIAYCGGGIAATADAFALALVGRTEDVAVYDGSLTEWVQDPTAPMETG